MRIGFAVALAVGGLAAIAATAGPAAGGSGGGTGGGGLAAPKAPELADVSCLERCAGLRAATAGARVELVGSRLGNVAHVRFKSKQGRIGVAPLAVTTKRVRVIVPDGAKNGTVKVVDAFGTKATTKRKLSIKPESAIDDPGDFSLSSVVVNRKAYYVDGPNKPTIKFLFEAESPVDVRVDLISTSSGEVVRSIVQQDQQPFAAAEVTWDGRRDEGGVAPNGTYRARVSPLSGGGKASKLRPEFGYYSHKFPVRGKHSYGDGLGAGRSHNGQDVFAKCGVPIVAARGGRVSVKGSQGQAGYYLVIDGSKTGRDYFYAHLKKGGRPNEGQRVKTGEQIGINSDSGNASGCHIHFELWSSPGWFRGGKVLNPTPKLRSWDGWS